MSRKGTKPHQRFWQDVEITSSCWLWNGPVDKDGYGRVFVDGRYVRAPRFVWSMLRGPIPDGMIVCHHCDKPPCCNPDHLFVGTYKDNTQDMVRKGRDYKLRGSDQPASKLTETQVREIRKRYEAGDILQKTLASEYSISRAAVCLILNRKSWEWLH
jgi:hypothetical protein